MKNKVQVIKYVILGLALALVVGEWLLWEPLKIWWYKTKLESSDSKEKMVAIEEILKLGADGQKTVMKHLNGKSMEWVQKTFGGPVLGPLTYLKEVPEGWDAKGGFLGTPKIIKNGIVYELHYENVRFMFDEAKRIKDVRLRNNPMFK